MSQDKVIFIAGKLYEERPEIEGCIGCAFLHTSQNCSSKVLSHCSRDGVIFVEKTAQPPEPLRASDPTNPKDLIGSKKLPLGVVPDTVMIYAAMAFAEGASKYGSHNWRAAPVRFSIYMEAMERHKQKLWNGEWADKKTKVPHLASIIACAGIIADAKQMGTLIDDRPPATDIERLIQEAEEVVAHVVQLNAHMAPRHWTINDKVPA